MWFVCVQIRSPWAEGTVEAGFREQAAPNRIQNLTKASNTPHDRAMHVSADLSTCLPPALSYDKELVAEEGADPAAHGMPSPEQ